MRAICLLAVLTMLTGGSALAQTYTSPGTNSRNAQSNQHPIDKGPFTPEANKAYMGGGVILQGAPGAPAPNPQTLPPGALPPAGSVPRTVPPG
jgi:hypothetical protein